MSGLPKLKPASVSGNEDIVFLTDTSEMKILFVGGPADGEWRSVLARADTYLVPKPNQMPWGPEPLEATRYFRVKFTDGYTTFEIMVTDVYLKNKEKLFPKLLLGYRPDKSLPETR